MKLLNLSVENFFPIGKEFLSFEHNNYAIFGLNHDDEGSSSNGSGKSALLHSIIWCLFGKTPREGLLSDGVIGPHGDYVRVVLTFEHNGSVYEIDRARKYPGRRSADPIVKIDGKDVSKHKNTDALISAYLGFDYATFMLAGYASAKKQSFCDLTPAKRREILSSCLDTPELDTYLKKVKEKGQSSLTESQLIQRQIDRVAGAIDNKISKLSELEESISSYEANKLARVVELENTLQGLKQRVRDVPDPSETRRSLDDAEALIGLLRGLLDKKRTLEANNTALSAKIETCNQLYKNLAVKKQQLLADLDVSNNVGSFCSHCGSKVEKVDTDIVNNIMSEIHSVELEMAMKSKDGLVAIKKLTDEQDDLREINKNLAGIDSIEEVGKRRDRLKAKMQEEIELQKSQYKLQRDIEAAQRELDIEMERDSSQLQSRHEDLSNDIEQLQDELSELNSKKTRLEDMISGLRVTVKLIKELQQETLFTFMTTLETSIKKTFEELGTDLDVQIKYDDGSVDLLFTNSSKDGVYYPYGIFSGGEAARIDKAVTLALNEVFGIGLFIDDEALASLDLEGSKAMIDYMFNREEHTRLLVFHNKLLEDYFVRKQNTRNILVEKSNGKAKIKIE